MGTFLGIFVLATISWVIIGMLVFCVVWIGCQLLDLVTASNKWSGLLWNMRTDKPLTLGDADEHVEHYGPAPGTSESKYEVWAIIVIGSSLSSELMAPAFYSVTGVTFLGTL